MAKTEDLQTALGALRASGAAERDPVRFAFIEVLARRAAVQPEAVRAVLSERIDDAVRKLGACPSEPATVISDEGASSPLAKLLADIGQHADDQPETPALRSVTRFHDTWARLSSEQQLTQTLAQAPENAGPMNSQHLVLRSLQVMRDIAPDYLQSFMSYIDTLVWLEQAAPTRAATRSSAGERENKSQATKRSATNR